jgi:thioredoxin reductase/ferredoxin
MSIVSQYVDWLHTRWPAGTIEKLPEVQADGTTTVPGLRVVGDLTGIPLLKFSVDSGTKAIRAILAEPRFSPNSTEGDMFDVAIIGGGLAGVAAAIEAKKAGLKFAMFEASRPFATIKDFPKGKPIFTYPADMTPAGELKVTGHVKEDLVTELEAQREAHGIQPIIERIERVERQRRGFVVHAKDATYKSQRVIVAIGRSGNFRKLGAKGENRAKVFNRLHDPMEFAGKRVVVVGGGDSAIEASLALALAGADVTHSYRGESFSRPKPENVEKINQLVADPHASVSVESPSSERVTTAFTPAMCGRMGEGSICLAMSTRVVEIRDAEADVMGADGMVQTLPNDVVFSMIGREPPLDFFRRSGVPIRGEWRPKTYVAFGLFVLFCIFLYHWKSYSAELPIYTWFKQRGWFPFNAGVFFDAMGHLVSSAANTKTHLLYTLKNSMSDGGFYYGLAYCVLVVVFGIRRVKRRRTPYVKLQTITLMAIQCIPLFILPQLLLPWAGENGWLQSGILGWVADQFFPNESYWRAYGLVLAWPLFFWNVFTPDPIWGWLILSLVQTFVIIPLMIRRWGKGAYCGWVCSCGALAETLGDTHRHKMPHGPIWNRLNMVGQVVLVLAMALLVLRICGWIWPGSAAQSLFESLLKDLPFFNYKWIVDVMLAGVLGVACYFWFSGRVWCRFACPLAALMHIFARFSQFRIFAEKEKCISCNVCTSACHQGIDIMNFANKGVPMEDPQCVRCSACVQSCPTGVLAFGRFDSNGDVVHDRVAASLVRVDEVGLPRRTGSSQ